MPKTKLQSFIFSTMMVFIMVYAMVCYNIAIAMGGMYNEIFLIALYEMPIMWPIGVALEYLIIGKLAKKLAFNIVSVDDKKIFIILAISSMTVCLMCPIMSLIATILFANPGRDIIAVWLQKTVMNFPMAFFFQIFFAGPVVRRLFSTLVKEK
ncbi:MAG: DUF2798 domain-containing protein [Clostridium sp.]|uniref:DUF2798 domain-containing protein n=1 Tax=Clostridium sp. TaxID=1506 RepID=UPI0025C14D15|nr:DUF2798 domain-containing protein [Clostridium sp.]MCF0146830.1 DUF2798 domain-containing protein [Clostridium sp.]